MIVCSFYTTDTPYKEEAEKLRESMAEYGIEGDILGVPTRNSWDLNTKWKPWVIKRAMNRHNMDVLYVDADATFHGKPEFNPGQCDMAAHVMDKAYWNQDTSKRKFSLMSGTLWFANTEKARDILDAWDRLNLDFPKTWDQRNLEHAVDFDKDKGVVKSDIKFCGLSERYCAIDKTMSGIKDPIIRHHQASRRLKGAIV